MEIILYSCLAGLSTLLGALIVLILAPKSSEHLAVLLGFAGGIMLSVVCFELLPTSIALGSIFSMSIAFCSGSILLYLLALYFHEKYTEMSTGEELLKIGYLVTIGIALHNLPEGIAIGTGVVTSPEISAVIAISLGLHNIPEGMAAAGPLKAANMHWFLILLLIILAGLVTPAGTLLGMVFLNVFPELVGASLSIAAGAMLYLVIAELLPKSRTYNAHLSNISVILGILTGILILS